MEILEIKRRMQNGQLYYCNDKALTNEQVRYLDLVHEYNQLRPSQSAEKSHLLKRMFSEIGEDCYIETPFSASWGGKHVSLGNHVYANFNLVLLDDGPIQIGDYVMIGPNVVICSATHPISPELRKKQAQYNKAVHIRNNVWIGAGCVIMPGVTIGENTVIGAGSIVTKDIPPDVVAFGTPCKPVRKIKDRDRQYYDCDKKIDIE